MKGDTLYPLNILKDKYPEIYASGIEKYKGREQVMEWFIPNLNCFWNDVIHLTALHPKIVKEALVEAGYKGNYITRCYEIDPSILTVENTIVYLYKSEPEDGKFDPENFVEFKPKDIEQYAIIPQSTKEHYKRSIENGKMPLTFAWVPHIFFKGSVDVKDLNIVHD